MNDIGRIDLPKIQIEHLDILSNGHSILKESYALKVCMDFNIPFLAEKLIRQHEGSTTRFDTWNGKIQGVWDLDLLAYIANHLGIKNVAAYIGRGAQARAYARAIKEHLNL